MWSTFTAAALVATVAAQDLYPGLSDQNHTCVIEKEYFSCSKNAVFGKTDVCCTETFGGLVLATQFWDTWADKTIPKNTWTLHGLWPDFCNGSYTQYCDLDRQYDPNPSPNTTNFPTAGTYVPPYTGPNIGTFLEPFGKYDLLAYMNKYWISQTGPSSSFWGHEFSKHATCYSTFEVPCYGPQYVNHTDVVDFFETAIAYYKRFPTFRFLKSKGIVPSNTTTYTLSDIESALASHHGGATPYVGCSGPRYNTTAAGAGSTDSGRTVISEVWYYMHVHGRPQNVMYRPVEQTGSSSCATTAGAINYYEQTANLTGPA